MIFAEFFGTTPLRVITLEQIAAYQKARIDADRTIAHRSRSPMAIGSDTQPLIKG